jgi:hypothetical protein
MDRKDNIIIKFLAVKRHLEGVLKVFLQFNNEFLIIPMECIPIYGIMPEVDKIIDYTTRKKKSTEEKLKVSR